MEKIKYAIPVFIIFVLVFSAGCASNKVADNKGAELSADSSNVPEPVKISEFVVGMGDTIDIAVYRHDDLKRSAKIDSSGKIMYPLIGDIDVSGKGIFSLRSEIQERLSKYIVNPQVVINVSAVQSQKIIILGEVRSPGVFLLDTELSVLDAISKAGGNTNDARLDSVFIARGGKDKQTARTVDVRRALSGDLSDNLMLKGGDIIYVPAKRIANVSRFFVYLSQILGPIVNLESGIVLWPQVEDALTGEDNRNTPLSIPVQ